MSFSIPLASLTSLLGMTPSFWFRSDSEALHIKKWSRQFLSRTGLMFGQVLSISSVPIVKTTDNSVQDAWSQMVTKKC